MAAPTLVFADVSEVLKAIVVIQLIVLIFVQWSKSSPFPVSEPILSCSAPKSDFCVQEACSWVVSSPEKTSNGSIAGHIDHFVVLPVTDTIVEQLTVEAGRNRVPHLPLHHSRGLGIILRSFQDVVFLEHCGILWYPLVILIENLLGSFDSFCNRVHLATCHQSLFAFSLKNLFLSNHSVAPI